MKIENIEDLRDHAIETLEKLSSGEISIEQAGVTGKLCENVMSTVKIQVEVAKMLGREPNIPFLGNTAKGRLITFNSKKLCNKKIDNPESLENGKDE